MIDLLWFVLIGAVAGWLAGQLTKGSGFGLGGNIAVGVVGAALGGLAFRAMGVQAYGTLGALGTATIGAIVFLFLLKEIRGRGTGKF